MKNPLKDKRIELGLSRKDMANKSGISVRMIESYENNSKSPTIKKLLKLAECYELTDGEIIEWMRFIGYNANEKRKE